MNVFLLTFIPSIQCKYYALAYYWETPMCSDYKSKL